MALGGAATINGQPIDPSRIEVTPPRANRQQMINGGYQSHYHAKGHVVKLTFGSSQFADELDIGVLRNALGTIPSVAVFAFTDHEGVARSLNLLVDEEVGDLIEVAGLAGQFTIELVEAA